MNVIKEVEPTTTPQETIEAQKHSSSGWFATLREAVFGSSQDFTEGNIRRAIVLLSLPMILEMIMESLFGIVNVFWVSRLGAEAIAIVGTTEALLVLVFGIAMGQHFNARPAERVRVIVHNLIVAVEIKDLCRQHQIVGVG